MCACVYVHARMRPHAWYSHWWRHPCTRVWACVCMLVVRMCKLPSSTSWTGRNTLDPLTPHSDQRPVHLHTPLPLHVSVRGESRRNSISTGMYNTGSACCVRRTVVLALVSGQLARPLCCLGTCSRVLLCASSCASCWLSMPNKRPPIQHPKDSHAKQSMLDLRLKVAHLLMMPQASTYCVIVSTAFA